MRDDYSPRVFTAIPAGTSLQYPLEMPELIHMNEPALEVFTDFRSNQPVVVTQDVSIDEALAKMKNLGVRLLLVIDSSGVLIGQITTCDILGDGPVRMALEAGVTHSDINVHMMMKPLSSMRVLEWPHLQGCRVGHIVATLHQLEQGYLLVMDQGRIRGLFSIGEISRRLGHDVSELALAAHSMAEICQRLDDY